MSVRFGVADPLLSVSAVYVCDRCGRFSTRHGTHAGEAPSGWRAVATPVGSDHVCRGCAATTPSRPARA